MPHNSLSLQAAFSYLFASEVEALKELARSLPDNPFVINIGAGTGKCFTVAGSGNVHDSEVYPKRTLNILDPRPPAPGRAEPPPYVGYCEEAGRAVIRV